MSRYSCFPNATSKIQSMDTGIIGASKRQYRRYHLQNMIDCDKLREGENIYEVYQISAMRWSVAAWNEISSTTISNCFNRKGLFDDLAVISSAVEVVKKQ